MNISGKILAVTGAGNGIGRQVVLRLVGAGASVAGIDLDAAGLAETARLAGGPGRLSTHLVDITDREAVEALPAAVVDEFGHVDGIVNIAGVIQQFVTVEQLPHSEIEKVLNVNFWGTVHVVKAFLPLLRERPEAAIVNVSSMGAYAPVPGQAVYAASKAAVKVLTEALYAELLETNIAVTVVFPGAIATDIAARSGVSIGDASSEAPAYRTTSPEKAAQVVVDAIAKGRFHARIGPDAMLMDRLSRLSPKAATTLIAKRMRGLLS